MSYLLRNLFLLVMLLGVNSAHAAWAYLCQQDADHDTVGYGSTSWNGTSSTCASADYTNIGMCIYGGPDNIPCIPPESEFDNCPSIPNTDQMDTDADGVGDACEDSDSDGILNGLDNCPLVINADQLNADGDAQGDVCDNDDDGDTVADSSDNCPLISNANQLDTDSDSLGDVCDPTPLGPDTDGDGVVDAVDAFPDDAAAKVDTDQDGMPDALLTFGTDSFETGALTAVPFAWTTGGGGNWSVQLTYKKDGSYAAKSPAINSWLQFSVSTHGATTLKFWSGIVSGFSGTRVNRFYIDGVQQYSQASLSLAWSEKTFPILAGTHTFRWEFDGCSATCSGYNAFLDDVRITFVTSLVEDGDDDGDGIPDASDSYPLDTDNDDIDNNADPDDDNDGLPDAMDPLPLQSKFNLNAPYKGSQLKDQTHVQ